LYGLWSFDRCGRAPLYIPTIQRHDEIRNLLYNIAKQGCLRVEKEEPDIFGNKKRPGDILTPPLATIQNCIVFFTIPISK
jgi:hypothetical protein